VLSFIAVPVATGGGERQDQNPSLFSRADLDGADGGRASEHNASERPWQTERDGSISG